MTHWSQMRVLTQTQIIHLETLGFKLKCLSIWYQEPKRDHSRPYERHWLVEVYSWI